MADGRPSTCSASWNRGSVDGRSGGGSRTTGKTLLVLDTASDDAERVYGRLGWQIVGVIPGYALWPRVGPSTRWCSTRHSATDRSRCCRPNRLGGRPSGYVAITTVSQVEVRLRCHRKRGAPSASDSTSTSRGSASEAIEDTAEEIAARTVNKERARAGEAERRAAARSTTSRPVDAGPASHTRRWRANPGSALQRGSHKGIKGRSKMNKAQLERAVGR